MPRESAEGEVAPASPFPAVGGPGGVSVAVQKKLGCEGGGKKCVAKIGERG